MELKEYEKIIAQTAVYPREVNNFGLAYTWLGLIDEASELYDALYNEHAEPRSYTKNIKKEFGDVMWYVTAICTETSISFEEVVNAFMKLKAIETVNVIGKYSGKIKKFYRDNKVIDKEELKKALASFMFECYFDVYDYTEKLNEGTKGEYPLIDLKASFSDVLELNYTKLIARRETNTLHGDGDNREER